MGDFLTAMEGVTVGPASQATSGDDEPSAAAASQVGIDEQPSALTVGAVLTYLEANGETSIPDVAVGLQSPILETVQLLGTLQSSGLVAIGGDPGVEIVSLTPAGRTLSTVT